MRTRFKKSRLSAEQQETKIVGPQVKHHSDNNAMRSIDEYYNTAIGCMTV